MSRNANHNSELPLLPSTEEFFTHQTKLLYLEKEEETGRNLELLTNKNDVKQLERQGIALRKITIQERRTGLYGKSILVFGKPGGAGKEQFGDLPANTLSNGKHLYLSYISNETKELIRKPKHPFYFDILYIQYTTFNLHKT